MRWNAGRDTKNGRLISVLLKPVPRFTFPFCTLLCSAAYPLTSFLKLMFGLWFDDMLGIQLCFFDARVALFSHQVFYMMWVLLKVVFCGDYFDD